VKAKGERQTVLEANQGFYDAIEARDISLMTKVWAQDGTVRCTQPNGVLLRGWEEVRRTFEQLFSADRPYKIELTQLYKEMAGRSPGRSERDGYPQIWRKYFELFSQNSKVGMEWVSKSDRFRPIFWPFAGRPPWEGWE
jgi:hypothetical protein